MSTVMRMLAILTITALPAVGYPQDGNIGFVVERSFGIFSQSTSEAVEVLIAVGDIPGNHEDSQTVRVTHGFEISVLTHPIASNGVTVDGPVNGLAKFRIEVGHETPEGDAPLIVNGQEICCVAVENNRVAYRANLRLSKKGLNSVTGEEVPIPPSVGGTVTTTVVDMVTGATRSQSPIILRPVIYNRSWDAT
jgi:hypothetical protein